MVEIYNSFKNILDISHAIFVPRFHGNTHTPYLGMWKDEKWLILATYQSDLQVINIKNNKSEATLHSDLFTLFAEKSLSI